MAHVDTSMGRRVEVDAVFGKPAIPAQAVTRSKKRAEAARPRGKAWRCVCSVCVWERVECLSLLAHPQLSSPAAICLVASQAPLASLPLTQCVKLARSLSSPP
jgi:hypothetical protein